VSTTVAETRTLGAHCVTPLQITAGIPLNQQKNKRNKNTQPSK